MKVKFIHTLLVAAAFVTASGAFVSCKDYESDDLAEVTNRVGQLSSQYEDRLSTLENKIANLKSCDCDQSRVAALETALSDIRTQISSIASGHSADSTAIAGLNDSKLDKADTVKINQRIENLKEAIVDSYAQLVTSVIVQGTYAPAFGTLALPLDVQSNLLVGYYGNNVEGTKKFPQTVTGVTSTGDVTKSEDFPSGTLFNDTIGKLYVTVNPTQVDLNNVKFALDNSKGEAANVTLGEATPETSVLTWGYTRADAGTAVYEIPATIDEDNLTDFQAGLTDKAELRAAVKQALTEHSTDKANIKNLAKKVAQFAYDNMNSKFPRLGVATQYSVNVNYSVNEGFTFGETTLNNVSNLNILAGVFKPAGFYALDPYFAELNESGRTEYGQDIDAAETKIVNFIKNRLSNINIQHVDNLNLTPSGTYELTGTDQNGNTVTVPADELVRQIYGDVNKSVNDDVIKSVNDMIDDLKGKVTGNTVTGYLDRLNNRLTYWGEKFGASALKPCVLVTKDGTTSRITEGKVLEAGTYKLTPTTFTYELLAPAYKKYIHVYNASDNALDEVYSGVESKDVTLKAGNYRVVYEAIDYNGQIAAKVYNITVQ